MDVRKCSHVGTLRASTQLIPNHVVVQCRACGGCRIDSDPEWIPGGDGVLDRLRAKVGVIEQQEAQNTAWEEMVNSDDDDPRWAKITD